MDGGDIDDASPSCLLHVGQGVLGEVEGGAEVEGDDLFPLGVGEVSDLVDVLHACVADQHVHTSEVFYSFLHDLLAIGRLGQIGEDELSLHLRVLLGEVRLSILDLLLSSKSVQNYVESPGSEGVSDAQTDA